MSNTRDLLDIVTIILTWGAALVTLITLPPVFISQFLKRVRIEIGPFSVSLTNGYKIGFTIKNPSVFHHRKIRQVYLILDNSIMITLNNPKLNDSNDFQQYINHVIDIPPQQIALGSFSYNSCEIFDTDFDISKLISKSKNAVIYYEDSFFKFHKIKYRDFNKNSKKKGNLISTKRFLKMKEKGVFISPSLFRSGFLNEEIILSDSVKFLITIINRVTLKKEQFHVLHNGTVSPLFYGNTSLPEDLIKSRDLLYRFIKKQLDQKDFYIEVDQNQFSRRSSFSYQKTPNEILRISKYRRKIRRKKMKNYDTVSPTPYLAIIEGIDYNIYFCAHDECKEYLGDLFSENEFNKRLGFGKEIISCPKCGRDLYVKDIMKKV